MQCPIDNTQLQMTAREGIEIDYCPKCRGVWLDRGELDKIIERAGGNDAQYGQSRPQPQHNDDDDEYNNHNRPDNREYNHDNHRKHKKESFLGDLFDF